MIPFNKLEKIMEMAWNQDMDKRPSFSELYLMLSGLNAIYSKKLG